MSISSISQSNVLGEDVLQMIFQYLDAEDLLKCEAVCRHWRGILLAGTPWRRLYHRNIVRLPQWRKDHKIFKNRANQLTWRTDQYRDYCKKILQGDRNWRRGHFTKSTYLEHHESGGLSISDDYVAWDFYRNENGEISHNCAFLDTGSMEIKEVIVSGSLVQLMSEEAIIWTNKDKLEIVDPKNRWVVNAYDGLAEKFGGFRAEIGNKLLVTTCYEGSNWHSRPRMRIWKIGNPPVLLQDRTFTAHIWEVKKVDERFIVCVESSSVLYRRTVWFISTETLEIIGGWSLARHCEWLYDRGLLFQFSRESDDNLIRILDVTTGFFNDVRLPVRNETRRSVRFMDLWASSNSRFIVIGWCYSSTDREHSYFSFYDLEAAKKPSSDCRCYPLYTVQFHGTELQFSIWSFVMDESLIAFNGADEKEDANVTVLNFANYGFVERKTSDLEEKQEADGKMKMKIIFDPIVDSLPLENC